MSTERAVERFLRQNLAKKRENRINKISVRHAAPGSKGHDVDDFAISEEGFDGDAIENLVQEILGRVQEDADGMGGQQRYVVHLYEEGNKRAIGRLPIRVRGAEDEFDDSASGEEAPNLRGLVQQQMRHNEALARMITIGFGGMIEKMSKRLDKSEDTVVRLLEQRQQMFDTLEQASSQQHERDTSLLLMESSEKRKDQLFEKLSLLLPAALNKLAGQKIMDADDPMTLMLRGFVNSLSQDQFQALLGTLSNEQKILVMQLVQAVKKPNGASKTQ